MSPALKHLHDSVHTQLLYVLARFTSEHAPLLVWLSHVCVCIECRVASQRCQSLEGGRSAWDWTNRLNLKDFNSVVAAGWICYGMATQVCVCVCVYLHTVNVNDILVLVRMVSGQRCYDVLWAVEKFRLCLHDFMSLWITSSIHSLYLHLCHFCSDCVFKQTKNITVLCSEVLSIPDYFLFSQSTQCSHWHCFITDLFWSKTTAFFLLSKS